MTNIHPSELRVGDMFHGSVYIKGRRVWNHHSYFVVNKTHSIIHIGFDDDRTHRRTMRFVGDKIYFQNKLTSRIYIKLKNRKIRTIPFFTYKETNKEEKIMAKKQYLLNTEIKSDEESEELTLKIKLNDNLQQALKAVTVIGVPSDGNMSFDKVIGTVKRPRIKRWCFQLFEHQSSYDYGKMIFAKDLIKNGEIEVKFESIVAIENCIESLRSGLKDFISAWYKTKDMSVNIELNVDE